MSFWLILSVTPSAEPPSSFADTWTAIGTVALAVIAFGAIGLAYQQLEEAAELRRAEYRAYVVVFAELATNRRTVYLAVQNVGRTLAENVTVEFKPDLWSPSDSVARKIATLVMWRNLPTLVPAYKMRTLWGTSAELFSQAAAGKPITFDVNITYSSPAVNRTYEEKSVVDLSVFLGTRATRPKDLGDVVKALEDIRNKLP